MRPEKSKNILLLCADSARHVGTVADHIDAFGRYSEHNIITLDSVIASKIDIDLSSFDAVVFHYSLVVSLKSYLPTAFSDKLAAYGGPKILFIQDEYRWVDRTTEAIKKLGISVVFTVVNSDVIRKIYRDPYFDTVRFEQTLTGFVPEDLISRKTPDYADRPIDVSYRARKLPSWCGSFALQKWQIGERFLRDADRYDLTCDIATSETSRMYGERWIDFIANSKSVLGTESGASFVDYSGEIFGMIDAFESAHPDATFDEIRDKFLEERDGNTVIHVISPRCFEAASLRTLMIMYPGEYSGILEPWRHYVPLAPDHSNMDKVVAILRDADRAGAIIHNAFEEIAKSDRWTFSSFIARFDKVVGEVAPEDALSRLSAAELEIRTAQQIQQLAELERRYERRARWTHRKMRAIQLVQRLRAETIEFISRHFPPSIARPLLSLDRICKNALKSVWKRFRQTEFN